MPPSALGALTMMRQAFIRSPYSRSMALSEVWMTAVWPRPPNSSIFWARSKPSFLPGTVSMASTGQSFSRESGWSSPTPSMGAISSLVPLATSMPAPLAMSSALWPTTEAAMPPFSVTMKSSSFLRSASVTTWAP